MDEVINVADDIESFSLCDAYICSPENCDQYIKSLSSLKIFHVNIRSINCNFDSLLVLMHRVKLQLDVVVLSECWLSACSSLPSIPGFNAFASNHTSQNDGVVTFVRNSLFCNVFYPEILDCNSILLKFDKISTAVLAIYRSPSTSNVDPFLISIDATLSQLKTFSSVVLTGDININIAPNSSDSSSDDYLNLISSHGMLPAYVLPTRGQNCLDHVMVKSTHTAVALVLDSYFTDHAPTLFCLHMRTQRKTLENLINKSDFTAIINEIEKTNFDIIMTQEDPNTAAQDFVNLISSAVGQHSKVIKIPSKNRILKPWITPGLLRCIRHRDRLYKRLNKNPCNQSLKVIFTRYRTFCNNLLKKVKKDYERLEIESAGRDPKATWKVIKDIVNIRRKTSSAEELLAVSSNPVESVNLINSFFAGVGQDLASKINPPSDPSLIIPNTNPFASMALFPTDNIELANIILNLKDKCAAGWDGIPTLVIKNSSHILIPPLAYIINLSMSSSTFPDVFKKALVHPIFKAGDRMSINNYRPISVLTVLSKVFEKVINKRLVHFLNAHNALAKQQYGFRQGTSTEDAVIDLTTKIAQNFETKLKTVGIFLDLSKAFDTVAIPILLDKLLAIGVRGAVNDFFKSYLTNRRQIVKINNVYSEERVINCGVPQGSVLGPTLFLVYINDLVNLPVPSCSIFTYADDTALLISGRDWSEAQTAANTALRLVLTWLSLNLLTLNSSKTKYITFSPASRSQPPPSFSLRAHTCDSPGSCQCPILERTTSLKYLGVWLDNTMSWKTHIQSTVSRVRKLIFIFKNLRGSANLPCMKMVYFALAQAVLSYCISAWGGSIKTLMLRVERAQRAVLKVMISKPRDFSTSSLYSICKVLSVRKLFVLSIIMRKHSQTIFDPNLVTEKRRSDIVCRTVKHKTAVAGRHYHYISSSLYNKINKIINIYPLTIFKCKCICTDWLISLSYEETEEILKFQK